MFNDTAPVTIARLSHDIITAIYMKLELHDIQYCKKTKLALKGSSPQTLLM